ncbi:MAG: HAD family hydrolase [Proteobacteria bacterium]|nr:HAD family hydrolase [Pseudomonadota bacterium]
MIPKIYPRKLPKAILFDWDNTLVDTWRVAYDSINIAREKLGLSAITIDDFWERPHHSMRDAAQDLFGDQCVEGERLFYETVKDLHLNELMALQGADALIDDLKGRDIYLGIVSNKQGDFLRKEVEHLGWKPHFKKVIGARDAEADKPSAIPVLAALKESSIDPGHDVWFVGDSIIDVHCARASGCIPIVVGDGEAAQQDDIIHAKDCHGLIKFISDL